MALSLVDSFKRFVAKYPHPNAVPNNAGVSSYNSWNQWCALGMALWGRYGEGQKWSSTGGTWGPGAVDVGRASGKLNRDATKAPRGAWHFWSNGKFGHVGRDLIGGGTHVGMFGTTHLRVKLNPYAGITSVKEYSDAVGGYYMGWATNYGGKTNSALAAPPQPTAPKPTKPFIKWAFNKPAKAIQKRIQIAMYKRGRYRGPRDGAWGINSIKGVQLTIRNVGYRGDIDGKPGPNTCYYVQIYARKWGKYDGPIDRVLGPNTWTTFMWGIESGLR